MKFKKSDILKFRRLIWKYYKEYGRDLPWRRTKNPYAIVVSEIMLQQTQVDRVRGKYEEFLEKFPTFARLGRARAREVLKAWQGLGYNRRALSLWKLAQTVMKEYKGELPHTPAELEALPGIGKATAGSVAAFAFNIPTVFVETNIRRAILHHFFLKKRRVSEEGIWELAAAVLDPKNPREWYWALMDYGSMLGKTVPNPNRRSASYRKQSPFQGSNRELRGRIVRLLLEQSRLAVSSLLALTQKSEARVQEILEALEREGFLRQRKGIIMIAK
ncbi:MAG: A/G-specific adenine glycosylase [Candidatus Liptonbacteria bacterium]|nr:A/G-specific adenine glycosylase [Candidatus Liptonbacteria bacterium]